MLPSQDLDQILRKNFLDLSSLDAGTDLFCPDILEPGRFFGGPARPGPFLYIKNRGPARPGPARSIF